LLDQVTCSEMLIKSFCLKFSIMFYKGVLVMGLWMTAAIVKISVFLV